MKLTKKNVFWISASYIIYFLLLLLVSSQCGSLCRIRKDDLFGLVLFLFSPLAPAFLFSLITYKMREEVFHSWLRFAYVWVPVSIFLVLVTPNGQSGGYMPSLIDKQVIVVFTSFLFVAISLILITYKSIRLKGK